jgi:P pilus assembly chaperone PapD
MQIKKSVFLFVFILLLPVITSANKRPVELIPQRIILEGRDRSTNIKLLNRNPEDMNYRISVVMRRQNISGGTKEIPNPTPEEKKIMKMIRFSPRQVRVPANSVQTVRLMVRKPANLPVGEYRAHLKATPVPDPKKEPSPDKGLAVKIDLIIAISIPIIIRHGETEVKLDAKEAQPANMRDGKEALKVRLTAEGNRSVYLDAEIYKGNTLLAEKKAFAIYQPNGQREIFLPLNSKLPQSGTPLRLLLRDREKKALPLVSEIPIELKY